MQYKNTSFSIQPGQRQPTNKRDVNSSGNQPHVDIARSFLAETQTCLKHNPLENKTWKEVIEGGDGQLLVGPSGSHAWKALDLILTVLLPNVQTGSQKNSY